MIFIYTLLILLAAFPMVLTIVRMRHSAAIKKKGIHVNAVVRQIRTIRTGKGGALDLLTLEYKDRTNGQPYNAKATVGQGQYKIGDSLSVAYLPANPSKYAIDHKGAYWGILTFCIVLFLFILFAVYKINEMVQSGSA